MALAFLVLFMVRLEKKEKRQMNLREQIEGFEPYNEQERADKEIMLNLIDTYKDVLTRENKVCHFTASNWIVNKERTKFKIT